MARPRSELSEILNGISGVKKVYFQAPTTMEYPCILYEVDDEFVARADNGPYTKYIRYLITVIDRNPDSTIPGAISDLRTARFDRRFVKDGLHHTTYLLYF